MSNPHRSDADWRQVEPADRLVRVRPMSTQAWIAFETPKIKHSELLAPVCTSVARTAAGHPGGRVGRSNQLTTEIFCLSDVVTTVFRDRITASPTSVGKRTSKGTTTPAPSTRRMVMRIPFVCSMNRVTRFGL